MKKRILPLFCCLVILSGCGLFNQSDNHDDSRAVYSQNRKKTSSAKVRSYAGQKSIRNYVRNDPSINLKCREESKKKKKIQFIMPDKSVKTITLEEMKRNFPVHQVEIFEWNSKSVQKYNGFRFNDILTYVYGDIWQEKEDLKFVASDGYSPILPVQSFRELPGFLTFERTDGKAFAINVTESDEGCVPLGPFSLVWDNIRKEKLFIEKKLKTSSPYQLIKVGFNSFKETYKKISPSEAGSEEVHEAFSEFAHTCLKCHTYNGVGGKKGGEIRTYLKKAYTTEKGDLDKEKLNTLIMDPRKKYILYDMKNGVTENAVPDFAMPAYESLIGEEKAEKLARQVILYLSAMEPVLDKRPAD